MIMTVSQRQSGLLENLLVLPDPQERLAYLVTEAARAPALAESERVPEIRVHGCISQVWLKRGFANGRCRFHSAADSPLVAGLVHLLCRIYDDAEPADILAVEPSLLETAGLWKNLSPTRQNGLQAVRREMADFARSQHPLPPH